MQRRLSFRPGSPVLALLFLAALAAPSDAASPAAGGLPALHYAFRFASAIETDPKDRAKAQELVVTEYMRAGALDEAREKAASIEGWRRGAVYADLAALLAKRGRIDEARSLVAKAQEIRAGVTGWEGPRILAHIGTALAALGDQNALSGITSDLTAADPVQYTGRATAALAASDAARGELGQALQKLDSLQGNSDFEMAWWRTAGYLDVGRQEKLFEAERLKALDAGAQAAEGIAGWKRAEALESLAEEYQRLGRRDRAERSLRSAQAALGSSAASGGQAALLSNLAEAWAKLGEPKRAIRLLKQAESAVGDAMLIDRPGIYANLASSYRRAGDAVEAGRLYERALDDAARLENARPRALAVAAVCRQMGRNGVELETKTRARLDALLAGLRDPW
jgi:tetratricopeptide (TPR) repeat protein